MVENVDSLLQECLRFCGCFLPSTFQNSTFCLIKRQNLKARRPASMTNPLPCLFPLFFCCCCVSPKKHNTTTLDFSSHFKFMADRDTVKRAYFIVRCFVLGCFCVSAKLVLNCLWIWDLLLLPLLTAFLTFPKLNSRAHRGVIVLDDLH